MYAKETRLHLKYLRFTSNTVIQSRANTEIEHTRNTEHLTELASSFIYYFTYIIMRSISFHFFLIFKYAIIT